MKKYVFLLFLLLLLGSFNVKAQRGCCSHHGGVSGCSTNGRQICNDGTFSPTCTCESVSLKTKGCTDLTAINYDANADTDDGSCKFKSNVTEKESIPYSTEYVEDLQVKKGSIEVQSEGQNGTNEITYEVISDSNHNVLSKKETKRETITPAINKIIKRNTSSDNNSNSASGLIGGSLMIGGAIWLFKKLKKK